MDARGWATNAAGPARRLTAPNAAPHLIARCGVMHVIYLTRAQQVDQEQACDGIEILIPGEGAILQTTYRSADGRCHSALLRDPLVSVIPDRERPAIHCYHDADLILITIDRTFFEEKVRAGVGAQACELSARFDAVDPFLRAVGNTLRNEFLAQEAPSPAFLDSLAGVLAIHVAKNYGREAEARCAYTGLPLHKLDCVQAFIREHLGEAILVRHLAAAVHMSPFHFARSFRKATGQPPHVYLTAQRVEHAKRLLRETSLALVDIAADAGFRTQGHFTTVFHRRTGVTPRRFRISAWAVDRSV